MMEVKPPVAFAVEPIPRATATRTVRKVALCGSHSDSLRDAPWNDPTWEFWGHASSRAWYRRPMDRYFDLHPRACWSRGGKKSALYPKWLAKNTVPLYMQDKYSEIPSSRRYPKGQVLAEFGDARSYFTNHVAWMIALAMTEGVSVLGLWGINYGTESEYVRQRGSAEYWLGRAAQSGIRIILPEQCTLLAEPSLLYGYESHDEETGLLKAAYRRREWKPSQTIEPMKPGEMRLLAKPPAELLTDIALEESEYPRPEWALGPLPERSDGGIGENA